MRVAVFHGASQPIAIEDVPDDPIGPGQVRIEVGRCGICGSDVSMTSGSPFDYAAGSRLGHESAGTVIELGPDVTKLKLGDRVSVLPRGFCGHCPPCRDGRPLFCETGPNQTGGFGERLVITETSGFRFPDSVSMAEGALVEPIACGRRAMRVARMEKGASILVMGAGSMGLAAIYWARRMGAGRITVVTRTAARHEIAQAMGADVTVSTADGDDALARALPAPPDIVVEATGKPGMVMAAAQQARLGGTVLSLGMCPSPDHIVPALNTFRELSILFPLAYAPEDFTATIRAFDAGDVRPGTMVSGTVPLEGIAKLLEDMRGTHDHLKVLVSPH